MIAFEWMVFVPLLADEPLQRLLSEKCDPETVAEVVATIAEMDAEDRAAREEFRNAMARGDYL